MGLFTGSGNIFDKVAQLFTDPKAAWDEFRTGGANATNAQIADENLAYQKERAKIEDERYAEETAYNRAWAEEERDYNRALQQQLFEREDTALERQASSLSSMGINPLSQQLNGLGAGSPVSSGAAPSASGRMAETPQNNFQAMESGMLPALSGMLSLADTVNGVKTGQYQRDALALQNDKQFLENLRLAGGLGIKYKGLLPANTSHNGYIDQAKKGFNTVVTMDDGTDLFESSPFKGAASSEWRKMRKDSMPNWQYTLDSLGQDDVYNQAENFLTKGAKLFDKVNDKLSSESIYDLGKNNKGFFNPFNMLMNLFY